MSYPEYPTAVREMAEEDRPRERLARLGAEVLRDAELLAVLFRTGTREVGAVALGEQVVRHFGSLRALNQASLEELQEVKGLGRVKAVEIKAALELGKRLAAFSGAERPRLRTAQDVADLLMVRFKDEETETFKCVLLNTRNDLLKVVTFSGGSLDSAPALPRDVFRQAIREGASGIILCHNHPSGDPEPSRDDIDLTTRLLEAGDLLGVRVVDHIVFGDGRFVSLKEKDYL